VTFERFLCFYKLSIIIFAKASSNRASDRAATIMSAGGLALANENAKWDLARD
jgi:hypothetical protein